MFIYFSKLSISPCHLKRILVSNWCLGLKFWSQGRGVMGHALRLASGGVLQCAPGMWLPHSLVQGLVCFCSQEAHFAELQASQWKPGHLRDMCVGGREELMCSQHCICRRLCLKCRACPHLNVSKSQWDAYLNSPNWKFLCCLGSSTTSKLPKCYGNRN